MSLFDRDRSADRLPVSVVTGFLGSGKTTLLNHLLRQPAMADSAVIVNEFGEIGLDHLMVEAIDGEMVVMASGCVCCTIRSDLETTLRTLMARRDAGTAPPFQRVLLETTGLADPAPIVQMLLNNPLVIHSFRLDTVAATVDAVHGSDQLDQHPESVKQAAIADRIVLTKTDMADPSSVAALRARLARLNPAAAPIAATMGAVDPAVLFGAGLYDPARRIPDVARWLAEEAYAESHDHHHHDHGHDHGHDEPDRNRHDARIAALCLTHDRPLDWMAVNGWLAALRAYRGPDLLRVKGILDLKDEAAPVAIHGVHHVFHPPTALAGWPDADRRSRIVLIGRDLDHDALRAEWQAIAEA